MGNVIHKIPRVTDEQIHRSLRDLANEFGAFNIDVQVCDAHLGRISYPDANDPNLAAVLAENSDLIFHFGGHVLGTSLTYYRGGIQGSASEKSPVFDDLAVDPGSFDPIRIKVVARTLELFRPVHLPRPADPISLLESQRALQESSFSRLQMQLEKVFEQTIDLRAQLDEQVREKEAALEHEFRQKDLEASKQLGIRVATLAQQEADLEDRRKSLDESDNTFARRQIRDRMLNDVAARVQDFGLSKTTVDARSPVAVGMGALCFFLLALLMWTSFELYSLRPVISLGPQLLAPVPGYAANVEVSSTERILLWIRFTFLSIGLAASILYYIRWQHNWATAFATTEQSLQQFHIDVNRANWVVETCLEWRKETASDIPEPLIESLTRGLFAGRETSQTVLHPADELASALMGSASKLSLDINGNKLDIDKPGKIPKAITPRSSSPTQAAA